MRPLTEWFDAAGLSAPDVDIPVRGFQADSRKVQQGDVFVAIAGASQNGTKFISSAIKNGAVAVVCEMQYKCSIPVIVVDNVRLAYAKLCAAMYPNQPQQIVAITGTNGKTSVAEFYRQIWSLAGEESASIGTLGLTQSDGKQNAKWASANTSPAPDVMHEALQELAQKKVQHVAIEASSHGLDQHRLSGVKIKAAAFTNLTQDHLDYHKNMESYFAAKSRLFSEFSAAAVVNADDEYGQKLLQQFPEACGYGERGEWIALRSVKATNSGLSFVIECEGSSAQLDVKLFGDFQVWNVVAALGLALKTGMSWDVAVRQLPKLEGVRGRMEKVATHSSGAAIFIDYAHTPDALKHLLISLRAHCTKKLHVVFGCGGDRDTTKRAVMGCVAAEFADHVVVTDDNPRSEDPELIRQQILYAAPNAIQVADRGAAISLALQALRAGDVLVVAGKGHETYQIIGDKTYEFNDARKIQEALGAL